MLLYRLLVRGPQCRGHSHHGQLKHLLPSKPIFPRSSAKSITSWSCRNQTQEAAEPCSAPAATHLSIARCRITRHTIRPFLLARFSTKQSSQDAPPPPTPRRRLLPKLSERENITNVPNILTISRLVATPIIGYLILHDQPTYAVGLLAYASITDWVDGYIARHWDLNTVIGTVLDPLADKFLMTVLTVCLATHGTLPLWIAGLILGRDVGLGIAAIYFRWISLPPPKTFTRYWDFSLPSAEVRPTTISKINTALQLLLLGVTTAHPLITADIATALTSLQYVVATTTVWSGASYIYTKDAVRILPLKKEAVEVTPEDGFFNGDRGKKSGGKW